MPEMDLDQVELDVTKKIGWTPPKSEHVHYDEPVLGHLGMKPEIVVPEPTDERIWVEIEPNVWFRPLFFDMNTGGHGEVLRVRRGGVLSRHRHPSPWQRQQEGVLSQGSTGRQLPAEGPAGFEAITPEGRGERHQSRSRKRRWPARMGP